MVSGLCENKVFEVSFEVNSDLFRSMFSPKLDYSTNKSQESAQFRVKRHGWTSLLSLIIMMDSDSPKSENELEKEDQAVSKNTSRMSDFPSFLSDQRRNNREFANETNFVITEHLTRFFFRGNSAPSRCSDRLNFGKHRQIKFLALRKRSKTLNTPGPFQ